MLFCFHRNFNEEGGFSSSASPHVSADSLCSFPVCSELTWFLDTCLSTATSSTRSANVPRSSLFPQGGGSLWDDPASQETCVDIATQLWWSRLSGRGRWHPAGRGGGCCSTPRSAKPDTGQRVSRERLFQKVSRNTGPSDSCDGRLNTRLLRPPPKGKKDLRLQLCPPTNTIVGTGTDQGAGETPLPPDASPCTRAQGTGWAGHATGQSRGLPAPPSSATQNAHPITSSGSRLALRLVTRSWPSLRGHFSQITNDPAGVTAWGGEAACGRGRWQLAAGWP